jgi:hypothetical protein
MDGGPVGEPQKRSGCIVALYVLFGIGLFVLVAGGLSTYFFLQSEQGQKILQVAKDGAEWVTVASQAPGTEELREAGCEAAMISDAGSAVDIFMTLIPEPGKQAEIREELEAQAGQTSLDELLLVICTLPRFNVNSPRCEELARTYGDAVSTAPLSFYVLVVAQGRDEPSCQGMFAPDGRLLD